MISTKKESEDTFERLSIELTLRSRYSSITSHTRKLYLRPQSSLIIILVKKLSFFRKNFLIRRQITIKIKYIKTKNIIGILSEALPVKVSLLIPSASNQFVTGLTSFILVPNTSSEIFDNRALFALARAKNPKKTLT